MDFPYDLLCYSMLALLGLVYLTALYHLEGVGVRNFNHLWIFSMTRYVMIYLDWMILYTHKEILTIHATDFYCLEIPNIFDFF